MSVISGEELIKDRKCKIFAELFRLSAKKGYDSLDFVKKVMTDKTLDWLFAVDDCQEWCDEAFLMSVMERQIDFKKGEILDDYLLWFAGYLYKYWMLKYSLDRRIIYKILPLKRLNASFGFYHTQGWDYVINDAVKVYIHKDYVI